MRAGEPNLLTTGQAVKLSFSSDTILKRIKKGRISDVRTAGGHRRIGQSKLEPLVVAKQPSGPPFHTIIDTDPVGLFSLEYLADHSVVADYSDWAAVMAYRRSQAPGSGDRLECVVGWRGAEVRRNSW